MFRIHRAVAALGAAALCTSLAACAGGGNIASVNGQSISKSDFDHKLESSPSSKQVLNQLVQQSLIEQYAKDKQITVSQADIDKKEDETRKKFPPGQFEQIVKNQGLTEQDVQSILREQIILEKAVAPQVHVSDADVKAFFDKNHAQFDKPMQVKARHILVADLPTANIVLAKLKAGGNWDALAKQYSTDPGSKDKGGELGYFGPNMMTPPFQAAAFGAKVGQIVGPVKSPFGYHIIQVEDKKPATKATLASVQQQIRDQLTQQQEQSLFGPLIQQLRSAAKVEVYDDRYKELATQPVAPGASGAPVAPASAAPAGAAPATAAPAPAATK